MQAEYDDAKAEPGLNTNQPLSVFELAPRLQAEYDEAKAKFEAEKKRARTPAKERTSDVHSELTDLK